MNISPKRLKKLKKSKRQSFKYAKKRKRKRKGGSLRKRKKKYNLRKRSLKKTGGLGEWKGRPRGQPRAHGSFVPPAAASAASTAVRKKKAKPAVSTPPLAVIPVHRRRSQSTIPARDTVRDRHARVSISLPGTRRRRGAQNRGSNKTTRKRKPSASTDATSAAAADREAAISRARGQTNAAAAAAIARSKILAARPHAAIAVPHQAPYQATAANVVAPPNPALTPSPSAPGIADIPGTPLALVNTDQTAIIPAAAVKQGFDITCKQMGEQLFTNMDKDNNGEISVREIIISHKKLVLGKDGRGQRYKGLDQLLNIFSLIKEGGTRDAFEKIFQEMDVDGSRTLSKTEFMNYITKWCKDHDFKGASTRAGGDIAGLAPMPAKVVASDDIGAIADAASIAHAANTPAAPPVAKPPTSALATQHAATVAAQLAKPPKVAEIKPKEIKFHIFGADEKGELQYYGGLTDEMLNDIKYHVMSQSIVVGDGEAEQRVEKIFEKIKNGESQIVPDGPDRKIQTWVKDEEEAAAELVRLDADVAAEGRTELAATKQEGGGARGGGDPLLKRGTFVTKCTAPVGIQKYCPMGVTKPCTVIVPEKDYPEFTLPEPESEPKPRAISRTVARQGRQPSKKGCEEQEVVVRVISKAPPGVAPALVTSGDIGATAETMVGSQMAAASGTKPS